MDQRYIDLYDRFTHGQMSRRAFFDRLSALAGGTAAASALMPMLQNNYALAATVAEDDARLAMGMEKFSGDMAEVSAYVARLKGADKRPAVIVIHENRGLNPHIRDIARRIGLAGFIGVAIDFLSPLGGTPADEDKARDMIGTLHAPDVITNARAVFAGLARRSDCTGKVGAIGFCWGGGHVNNLAVNEPALGAGVAYYGMQAKAAEVDRIKAPLMLHYAALDERINAGIPAYEAALKAAGKAYELHMYAGVNHAFNNDTSPSRYDKAAADLAWSRTIAFLKKHLDAAA